MRRTLLTLALVAACVAAAPAEAQDNLITIGHFTTVAVQNIPAFEEAAREHAQ